MSHADEVVIGHADVKRSQRLTSGADRDRVDMDDADGFWPAFVHLRAP
jgi:hypothetical protein